MNLLADLFRNPVEKQDRKTVCSLFLTGHLRFLGGLLERHRTGRIRGLRSAVPAEMVAERNRGRLLPRRLIPGNQFRGCRYIF